jgi:hypothetical protein
LSSKPAKLEFDSSLPSAASKSLGVVDGDKDDVAFSDTVMGKGAEDSANVSELLVLKVLEGNRPRS